MATAGMGLLVGHHPHVLQPIEWLGDAICLYSVGNLNGPTSLLLRWPSRLMGIFEVQLVSSGSLRGQVAAYRLHPFVQLHRRRRISLVPLDAVPDHLRRKFEGRLALIYPEDHQRPRQPEGSS